MTTQVRVLTPATGSAAGATAEDEVMRRTDWSRLNGGWSNFCTHRLKVRSSRRVEFRMTVGAALFALSFVAGGAIVFAVGSTAEGVAGGFSHAALLRFLGLGVVATGAVLIYSLARPRVFDRARGWFWRGAQPLSRPSTKDGRWAGTLDEIHALQLIREPLDSSAADGASHSTYELNLVLHDAGRINVVDHRNLAKLREDANRLAQFLGVPLWDWV